MLRVIVSVRLDSEKCGRDLEVPAEIGARQLAATVAKALSWSDDPLVHYSVRAEPAGRELGDDESLASAGLWDGTHLVFREDREV